MKPLVNVLYISRADKEADLSKAFWESWHRFDPGMDCGINIVCKGPWDGNRALGYLRRLADRTEGYVYGHHVYAMQQYRTPLTPWTTFKKRSEDAWRALGLGGYFPRLSALRSQWTYSRPQKDS